MHLIHESTRALTGGGTAQRWRARLIEADRWGSSGYYPRDVLEADGPTAWPAGTPVYLDHPTETEILDRPERSVRDLAGTIATTPIMEGDGLYAEINFYPHVAPLIEAIGTDVGLSIRATAEVEAGERDGRHGWIVTALTEGKSVDVVTKAGAGGKLITLLESARRQAHAAEAAGISFEDLRTLLQAAVKEGRGRGEWSFLHDFTDTDVIYSIETDGEAAKVWKQPYRLTDGQVVLEGDPIQVRPHTEYIPINPPTDPAGSTQKTATESQKETTMATVQIEEAELGRLKEQSGRVTALETERDTALQERDKARKDLTEALRAADQAQAHQIVAAAEAWKFNELETQGLIATMPVNESGRLDIEAFTRQVTEAATKRAAEAGAGRPWGMGTGPTPTDGMAPDEFDNAISNLKKGII